MAAFIRTTNPVISVISSIKVLQLCTRLSILISLFQGSGEQSRMSSLLHQHYCSELVHDAIVTSFVFYSFVGDELLHFFYVLIRKMIVKQLVIIVLAFLSKLLLVCFDAILAT